MIREVDRRRGREHRTSDFVNHGWIFHFRRGGRQERWVMRREREKEGARFLFDFRMGETQVSSSPFTRPHPIEAGLLN